MMLTANAGFLLSFVAGNYLNYHEIPFIGLAMSIVYFMTFIFFPETPTFLLKTGKEQVRNESHGESEKRNIYAILLFSWQRNHFGFIEILQWMWNSPTSAKKNGNS